jgi:hypothetical protein
MKRPTPKPVVWLGDTLAMVRACPQDVQDEVGYALYLAQIGDKILSIEAAEGTRPRRPGDRFRPSRRYVSERLHGPVYRRGVRASCLPEEIQEGRPNAAVRN